MFESHPILTLRKTVAIVLTASCLFTGYAQRTYAQAGMACHSMDMRVEVAPEQLPPPQKLTGIGNAHIPITATPEAQMWFDQGLNLLHDFWDYESIRASRRCRHRRRLRRSRETLTAGSRKTILGRHHRRPARRRSPALGSR